jgi:hypothetical protein
MSKKSLLLVGSPKPKNSSSEAMGDYLLQQLSSKGIQTEKMLINQVLKTEEGIKQFLAAVNNCDIFIISAPLYVDSAPAALTKAMELMAQDRVKGEEGKKQRLLAISNCGFPEAVHNNMALDIYRSFAKEVGFIWAGGLALGAGGAIDGKPLASLGGMVKNIKHSLELTAQALAEENPIPSVAVSLMAKPVMPNWLYVLAGNFMWKSRAKKNSAKNKINDKPYAV